MEEVKAKEVKAEPVVTVVAEETTTNTTKISGEKALFVSEEDTFDITVTYYQENGKLYVMGHDDDFDVAHENFKLTCTFKYPSLGDSQTINAMSGVDASELTSSNLNRLEVVRLMTLIRKWSSELMDLNNDNIMSLHPKVVKSLINQMRTIIGIDGL